MGDARVASALDEGEMAAVLSTVVDPAIKNSGARRAQISGASLIAPDLYQRGTDAMDRSPVNEAGAWVDPYGKAR